MSASPMPWRRNGVEPKLFFKEVFMVTVYRLPNTTSAPSRSALICHLREITVGDAISRLQKAGVLAIPGPEAESITLVGYHYETLELLDEYRVYGFAHTRHARCRLGWIKRLSASA
jgi:hypothetical protein